MSRIVGDNTVSVIDTATNTVVATIPVGNFPLGVAVTPDGTKVYVANFSDNTVSVIHTATNTVVKTIPVGTGPMAVAVTPDGTKVYVTNDGSNNVSVIHRPGNTVVATIPVGTHPAGVAVTPDGTQVYVTNAADNTVSVIDTATNTVVAYRSRWGRAQIGSRSPRMGHRSTSRIHGSGSVSVIRTANRAVVGRFRWGSPEGRRHPGWDTRLCHEWGSQSTTFR